VPFLAFPPTGAAPDHLHHQRDRVPELPTPQDHQEPWALPTNDAVIKLLWLAIRDIEDKRTRQRASEKGIPAADRRPPARLVERTVIQGWRQALGALALTYPDRLAPCPN